MKLTSEYLLESLNPSPEHERLRNCLVNFAIRLGCSIKCNKLSDDKFPDVLRITPNRRYLFLGDAKVSENETARREETVEKIKGYIKEFVEISSRKGIRGKIAIATDNIDAAYDWSNKLTILTTIAGLRGFFGELPEFVVLKIDNNTFIVQSSN
ncbi:MAG TPA: hypothetical protein PLZ43_13100 [bacterium]|nr:hypothetical protein [bacterium]